MKYDRSSLRIEYTNQRSMWEFHESPVRSWHFTIDIALDDGDLDERTAVGQGEALVVELHGRDPFDAMDEHSQAAMELAEHVFDPSVGGLQEDLADKLETLGDRVLFLTELEIEKRWRGLGLGPVIAGTVIDSLGGGALAVVCKPAPLHRPIGPDGEEREYSDGEWEAGVAKLSELWAVLGFEHHAGGVHFLDPALAAPGRNYRAVMERYLAVDHPLEPGPDGPPPSPLRLV